jgi:CBS domain-containing protein
MSSPPVIIRALEPVHKMAALLLQNKHGGFPVVKPSTTTGNNIFFGLITRSEIKT